MALVFSLPTTMSKFSADAGDRLLLAFTALVGVSLVVAGSWKALRWLGHGHLPEDDLNIQARAADDAVGRPRDTVGRSESPSINDDKLHSSKQHERRHHHHHHHHKHAKSMGSSDHKNHVHHDKDGIVETGRVSQSRSHTEPRVLGRGQTHHDDECAKDSGQILPFRGTSSQFGSQANFVLRFV